MPEGDGPSPPLPPIPTPEGAPEVIARDLRTLVPYERNTRTHPPEQIAILKQSFARFGWTSPMLIAGNDLLAGHARLKAALEMAQAGEPIRWNADPWSGPTLDLSRLSPDERRAYMITDNKVAELAGWDMSLLAQEMKELEATDFDLTLTGFGLEEIAEIMAPPGEPDELKDRELTKLENDQLDVAWLQLSRDWRGIMDDSKVRGYASTSTTKGALAVHYLRALFLGKEIPRTATLAYTSHRIFTSANHGSISDAIDLAVVDENRGRRDALRWLCAEKPHFDTFCCGTSMPLQGFRAPNDFPASLARDLIEELSLPGEAVVLDPCHGWGGRMLGFLLASNAVEYHGFDPSPLTHIGVKAMHADLAALTPERKKLASLHELPFERAKLKPNSYDFALTSPPYYDVEQYEGEESSHRVYKKFDDWVAGFYMPMIRAVSRALKPGAIFALQVGSQRYKLSQIAIDLAPAHGLQHAETRTTGMVNNRTETEPEEGEVVVVLRKPS